MPTRVLRIAHLTDAHVFAERNSAAGFEACLAHCQSQADPPDIIFTGGDIVMDTLACSLDAAKKQWRIVTDILHANLRIPVEHCIGNHDVWGWDYRGSQFTDHNYGKALALENLGLATPYRSFDRAGWHFVVLDSTHPSPQGHGYTAKLDDEQFEWLENDLAQTGKPVFILSHIPILCMSAFLDGDNEATGDWRVPGAWMHIDARRIKDLFKEHPNVKLCVSGHIHLVDRVEYLGVTYLCLGAVCGGWWNGPFQECESGYSLIDLYDDGSFQSEYVTYGWKP
jgi:Icc protein